MSNVQAIESSLYDYLLEFGKVPGGLHGASGATKWTYTGSPLLNRIFDARFEADPKPQIENVLKFYQQQKLPVTWMIGPSSRPKALGRFLQSFAFEPINEWLGMSLNLSQLAEKPDPKGFSCQPVNSQRDLKSWTSITRPAFGLAKDTEAMFRTIFDNLLLGERAPFQGYLAFLEGHPCATCFCFTQASTVGIFWVATAQEARGQGLATALTRQALREAQNKGAQLAVLHATPMGIPLYEKMGFQAECVFNLYHRSLEGA